MLDMLMPCTAVRQYASRACAMRVIARKTSQGAESIIMHAGSRSMLTLARHVLLAEAGAGSHKAVVSCFVAALDAVPGLHFAPLGIPWEGKHVVGLPTKGFCLCLEEPTLSVWILFPLSHHDEQVEQA